MARATEEERQLWRLRIHEMEESGMYMSEWCKEHNIPESTMGYWKRVIKKEDASENAPGWLKIDQQQIPPTVSRLQIPAEAASSPGVIALKYAGFSIELPISCDTRQVFEMLQVLRAL